MQTTQEKAIIITPDREATRALYVQQYPNDKHGPGRGWKRQVSRLLAKPGLCAMMNEEAQRKFYGDDYETVMRDLA